MFNILAPNSKLLEKRSKITNNISCKKNFARELIISKRIIIVVKDWHATNHIIIRKITFAGSEQRYTIYGIENLNSRKIFNRDDGRW